MPWWNASDWEFEPQLTLIFFSLLCCFTNIYFCLAGDPKVWNSLIKKNSYDLNPDILCIFFFFYSLRAHFDRVTIFFWPFRFESIIRHWIWMNGTIFYQFLSHNFTWAPINILSHKLAWNKIFGTSTGQFFNCLQKINNMFWKVID